MSDKDRARALYVKAKKLLEGTNNGKADEAFTLLTEAFSLDPLNPHINQRLAGLYSQKGDLGKQEDHLLRAAPFVKYPGLIYESLALLYLRTGKVRKAISAAEKAVELSPDDPSPQTTLTEVYLQSKDYEAALQSVLRVKELCALEGNHEDSQSVIPLARALEGLGRLKEAITVLRTGTAYEHVDEETYYYLADLIFKTPECTQAEMYALILEGIATANYEPTNDPFDVELYKTGAVICAAQEDLVNQARFLIRAELNTPKEPFSRKDDIRRLLAEAEINKRPLRQIFELEFRFARPEEDLKSSELLELLTEVELLASADHAPVQ